MTTLRLIQQMDALRLIARSCVTGTVGEILSVTCDVLATAGVPAAAWHVSPAGTWLVDGPFDEVPEPFGDHEWTVVPVVVKGRDIAAVLMSPLVHPEVVEQLETIADLVAVAALRELTRRELATIRERITDFQDLSGMATFEWEIATGRISWSDRMYEVHGRDARDGAPTYREWVAQTLEHDRDRQTDEHLDALGTSREWTSLTQIVRVNDGQLRTIRTRGRVVTDQAGRAIRMIGLIEDITAEFEIQRTASTNTFVGQGTHTD